jgi:hypothetical protein
MSGQWLVPTAAEHRCRTPFLLPFYVHIGDRWKCTARLGEGEMCGRIWRVTEGPEGRIWMRDNPDAPEDCQVFRPVTDDQLKYWLSQELGVPLDHPLEPAKVVAAIRKHFEIGSRR